MTLFDNGLRPAILAAALAATTMAVHAAEPAEPGWLLEAIRGGGHVLYIRHASTERDYADQIDAVMGDCGTQRTLSADGWQEARLLGAAFRLLDVPVGAVYSSEYCRAWQTAEIAFDRHVALAALNFEPAETYSAEQTEAMRDRVTPLLSVQPADGTNTIYVGHDDPFEAATGIYPEPMGVVYVLKPEGDGFKVLGAIAPGAWSSLIATAD